jgi:hypothetical protein
MLCILDFTIHFATLYFINCACSRSNSRPERRENEKKPFDRIEGRKCMMKFLAEKTFSVFRRKRFSCKKRGTIYQRGTRPIYGYIMGCTF